MHFFFQKKKLFVCAQLEEWQRQLDILYERQRDADQMSITPGCDCEFSFLSAPPFLANSPFICTLQLSRLAGMPHKELTNDLLPV